MKDETEKQEEADDGKHKDVNESPVVRRIPVRPLGSLLRDQHRNEEEVDQHQQKHLPSML